MPSSNPIRDDLRRLRRDKPGTRFYDWHLSRKHGSFLQKTALTILSFFIMIAGILMLIFPGPGIVGIVVALAMISGFSSKLAKALDRFELAVRSILHWVYTHRLIAAAVGLIALGIIAIIIWYLNDRYDLLRYLDNLESFYR